MTKRSGGQFHGKTRNLVRHHKLSTLSIADKIKTFEIGDKVAIVPKSNYRDSPHPRYKGRIGEVIEKRGSAYVVRVRIMNATRKLVVPVVHLEKI
ncbi:50S ribosomal protein L21e [Candidatus Mancarchaeum acidiphilum]|uniref:50S ribosomal protein L21e n=1 Tax=Candidatus Mancarchaeum acidiphilum TaxID=1920749 RepID=A0A218NLZ4_9ARCH|nr:50S ribosomal protein L21e [Candidatus Mancarchaeum acidiphilum]ASI13486.1 50S ribosomal protein L21e [Candidatus Mancarchaeum acidiphilum]